MGSELSSLTIFFPCLNERDNIERVTRAAIEAARSMCSDFEIIIVNDGSTDGTYDYPDMSSDNGFVLFCFVSQKHIGVVFWDYTEWTFTW